MCDRTVSLVNRVLPLVHDDWSHVAALPICVGIAMSCGYVDEPLVLINDPKFEDRNESVRGLRVRGPTERSGAMCGGEAQHAPVSQLPGRRKPPERTVDEAEKRLFPDGLAEMRRDRKCPARGGGSARRQFRAAGRGSPRARSKIRTTTAPSGSPGKAPLVLRAKVEGTPPRPGRFHHEERDAGARNAAQRIQNRRQHLDDSASKDPFTRKDEHDEAPRASAIERRTACRSSICPIR
jgi:hypothetical protein